MTVKEKIIAALSAVAAYDVALVRDAWHIEDDSARTVALAMADFGRMKAFAQKFVGFDDVYGRWAVDVEKSTKYIDYDFTRRAASDDFLSEVLAFDILENTIKKLKFIGFTREHRLTGGAYLFSFKLDDGTVVDVLQSPADVELINFEVDGKVEAWADDFCKVITAQVKS